MKIKTRKLDNEINALMRLRDDQIDTSDIPEVTDWSKAVVGRFYRPIKAPVTIRLDADIVAQLKSEGPGYQTKINALLRKTLTEDKGSACAFSAAAVETEAKLSGEDFGSVCAKFRFPNLERQQELVKYSHVAELIAKRGSVFAPAA